jgi:hypothetical protein
MTAARSERDAYGVLDLLHFVWTCHGCKTAVGDGDGYLEVDWIAASDAVYATRRLRAEYEARANGGLVVLTMTDLERYPEDLPWLVWHRRCDSEPEGGGYWIAVERARTVGQILDWSAHLEEKNWQAHTNWHRFIAAAASSAVARGSTKVNRQS